MNGPAAILDANRPLPYTTQPRVVTDKDASADGAIYLSKVFIAAQHGEIPLDLQTSRPVFVDSFALRGVDPGTGEFGLIQSSYGGAQLHLTNGLLESELIGLPDTYQARALNVPWSVVNLTADALTLRGGAGIRVRNAPDAPNPKRVAFSRISAENIGAARDDGSGGRTRGNVWADSSPNQSQRQSQFLVLDGIKGCSATFDGLRVTNSPGLTTAEDLVSLRNCDGLTFTDVLLDGHYRGRVDDSSNTHFNAKAAFGPAVNGDGSDAHGVYTDGRGYVDSGCSVILGDQGPVANIVFRNLTILEMYVAFALEGGARNIQIQGSTFLRSGFTPDGRLRVPQTGYLFQVSDWIKQNPGAVGGSRFDGLTLGYDFYPVGDGTRHSGCPLDSGTLAALKQAGVSLGKVSYVYPTLARIQQARDAMTKTWAASGKAPGLLTA